MCCVCIHSKNLQNAFLHSLLYPGRGRRWSSPLCPCCPGPPCRACTAASFPTCSAAAPGGKAPAARRPGWTRPPHLADPVRLPWGVGAEENEKTSLNGGTGWKMGFLHIHISGTSYFSRNPGNKAQMHRFNIDICISPDTLKHLDRWQCGQSTQSKSVLCSDALLFYI